MYLHPIKLGGALEKMSMSNIGSKVQVLIVSIIAAVIMILVGVALTPTVIESIADINATTLSGVPLADVLILLAEYLPFFFVLGIVLGGLGMIWKATGGMK